jgi:hypothetical protein
VNFVNFNKMSGNAISGFPSRSATSNWASIYTFHLFDKHGRGNGKVNYGQLDSPSKGQVRDCRSKLCLQYRIFRRALSCCFEIHTNSILY